MRLISWRCAGTLPNVGQAHKEPKLHTSDTDTMFSKTGAGAPDSLTHPKDIDYTPNLTTKPPPSSAFTSGIGSGSKPGTCCLLCETWLVSCQRQEVFLYKALIG